MIITVTMVLNNSQALFAVPASTVSPGPSPKRRNTSKADMHRLPRTLSQALHSRSPLTELAAGLGSQLNADACILIGFQLETAAITLSLWRPQVPPQLWQMPDGLPTAATARHLALTLIETATQESLQAVAQGALQVTRDDWMETLGQLLDIGEESSWLGKMRSHQVIPFKASADTEGLILLMGRQSRPWSSLPADLVDELRNLVALAFHQHHLHQQALQSIEQLRYLNQLKDDFLSTLSHELRTPLTSMMLAIRMLRRPDLTPDRKAMYLDILEQQCTRETALVNDLLALQTIESNTCPIHLSSLNLNLFLRSLIAAEEESFDRVGLGLKLDMPQQWITLETEPNNLTRILQELLTNARKYAEPGTVVTLSVEKGTAAAEESVVMHLLNEGTRIRPEELPHIFDKFRRGQEATQRAIPGTGTGLALVKGLVQQLQGDISVTSQPTPDEAIWQTCFTLCLPQYMPQSLATG